MLFLIFPYGKELMEFIEPRHQQLKAKFEMIIETPSIANIDREE